MSLRTKLTLALLSMSFAAISVVAISARVVMADRFDDFVVERASEGFVREVIAYHRAYGSWEAARASEPFLEFSRRERLVPGFEDGPVRGAPDARGQADDPNRPPVRRFPMGGEPPPFVVTNRDGEALLPLGRMDVGERVAPDRLALARPIMDGPEEIGMAVPLDRPALTDMEERYLSSMRTSWLFGVLLATILAVPVGLFVGDRLTRSLRAIGGAMDRMSEGSLLQQVPVRGKDEVGHLAKSFNEMSARLSSAYDELRASRAELDMQAKELAELSRQDPLTGLLNRRGFFERVGVILTQSKRYEHAVCVAMLDVDHFKRINDEYSHAIGDQVLVRVGDILSEELRESDLLGRYGGEEFVLALPETRMATAEALAERLRSALEEADWSDLMPGNSLTVSIGISDVDPDEGLTPALGRADERLYRAKERGRNRVEA